MKRSVKVALTVVVLAVMTMAMGGCSEKLDQYTEQTATLSQSVSFPSEYSITYEVKNSDDSITTVTKAKDASGSIYFRSGDIEKLYIYVSSNHYALYEKDDTNSFKLVSDWKGYTAVYVREDTKLFTEYTESSKKQSAPTVSKVKEYKVAGRICDEYEIKTGAGNLMRKYIFHVDKETGICLGWQAVGTADTGRIKTKEDISFTCVDFQTENITLPSTHD